MNWVCLLLKPADAPFTVIVYWPGAAVPVFMVKVLEQVELQEIGENEDVMPPGRLTVENETD